MPSRLLDHSLAELKKLLDAKKVSSVELVTEALQQTEATTGLHSFVTVRQKEAILKEAEQADQERAAATDSAELSVLHGIPFSMKDAYNTKGVRTTAGSRVLENYIPPYSATVYQKLQENHAILIGKNNQDAWGHGGSTENTDFGAAKNPWDTNRIAGGSSGGSAVAVATRAVAFAIGEDTGGSIRNPANMCNVTGLKVTYGRVSRYGAIAYASSLDTVGPMAKSVADIAYVLEAIAGHDPKDATSSSKSCEEYSSYLGQSIRGKKIGLPIEFYGDGLDPEVRKRIEAAKTTFTELGATCNEVSIPYLKHGIPIYYLIALSETSSNMGRYDGIRYGKGRTEFTEETARRIMVGTFALSAGYADELYNNAQKARTILIEEYNQALEECDVLLAPVTPGPAVKFGELLNDPVRNLLEDMYTVTVNVVGVPSLALPAGFAANGLPIGMQLIGKKFHEGELIQVGDAFQQVTEYHKQVPPVMTQ